MANDTSTTSHKEKLRKRNAACGKESEQRNVFKKIAGPLKRGESGLPCDIILCKQTIVLFYSNKNNNFRYLGGALFQSFLHLKGKQKVVATA